MTRLFRRLSEDRSRFVTAFVGGTCRLAALFCCFAVSVVYGNTLELIRKIPHSGYSEGLDFHEGFLWHAIPKAILKIDPKDGEVLARYTPPSDYSESLTWFQGKLFNLSFSNNGIYVGTVGKNSLKMEKKGTTPEVHGWGMAHDGKKIIITGDYSNKLYWLDPKTLKVTKTLETEGKDLEDLAWDGKLIWTSSFTADRGHIFSIDPKTGKIGGKYPLPKPEECPVVDGIAWDGKAFWVTGKECPSIYYVKPTESRAVTGKK